jgi:hypothetical protein
MRNTRRLTAVLLLVLGMAGLTAACSSGSSSSAPKSAPKKKDTSAGVRVLECTVVERGQGSPSRTSAYATGETYYLVFETKEGEATARYRFDVTRQQWFRYQEGDRVRITLNNNILTDIRPGTEP